MTGPVWPAAATCLAFCLALTLLGIRRKWPGIRREWTRYQRLSRTLKELKQQEKAR